MAIASGTLEGHQLTEAEELVAAKRGIAPSTSLDPEHAEVSLERTNPEILTELTDLTGKYIEDSDGATWLGDELWEMVFSLGGAAGEYRPADTDNLRFFAKHLQTMIDQKKINSTNIKTISAIILGRMDGKVRDELDAMGAGTAGQTTMERGQEGREFSQAWDVIMPILQGNMPTP